MGVKLLISLSFLDIDSGVPLFRIRQVISPTLALKLKKKSHVKDLGVKLSNDTTFFGHIGEKVASVKTKIGQVLRTFRTQEHQPMLALWTQQILCDLDYCSQL